MEDQTSPLLNFTMYLVSAILGIVCIKIFVNGAYCNIHKNLKGQNIIVTGCDIGIGRETARRLAAEGAHIICACLSEKAVQPLIEELRQKHGKNSAVFEEIDLSELSKIDNFVKKIKQKYTKIDTLVNNAGVLFLCDPIKKVNKQNIELQWAVNFLGHTYLQLQLLDLLKNAEQGRIVNVASEYHTYKLGFSKTGIINWEDINWDKYYNGLCAYSQSKLAEIMFAKELAKKFEQKQLNIKTVTLHPGCVNTTISKNFGNGSCLIKIIYLFLKPIIAFLGLKDVKYGAQTSIHCALVDFNQLQNGGYYEECRLSKSSKISHDQEQITRLWNYTFEKLNIKELI